MARAKTGSAGNGLLDSLRNSPETKRLTEEAKHLFSAGGSKLTGKLGDGVTGAAKKLTDIGESGSLGLKGEGAKRMLSGDGPVKSAVGAVTDKAKNLLGKGGKGGGKSKAMNIEETIDIGVPVSVAYNQWTQFQDFSRFMKGVESVEQSDDTELTWRTKVFKSTRTWKAKIEEQVPDRRIVWTSDGSKGTTKGVVTFHPLADDLTRVLVALEYFPSGIVEKTGNLWRAAGRRVRLDLKSFRRFVMMENEETGSWRGEIRDGDVVKQSDEDDAEDGGQQDDDADDGQRHDDKDRDDSSRSRASSAPRSRGSSTRRRSSSSSAEEAPARRSSSRRSSTEKGSTRQTPARKSTARKSTSRKAEDQKSGDQKPADQKPTAKKAPARKSTARKSTARKSTARKSTARKSTATKAPASKRTAKQAPVRKSTAKNAPARKSTAKKAPARKSTAKNAPARKSTSRKSTARKSTSRRSS